MRRVECTSDLKFPAAWATLVGRILHLLPTYGLNVSLPCSVSWRCGAQGGSGLKLWPCLAGDEIRLNKFGSYLVMRGCFRSFGFNYFVVGLRRRRQREEFWLLSLCFSGDTTDTINKSVMLSSKNQLGKSRSADCRQCVIAQVTPTTIWTRDSASSQHIWRERTSSRLQRNAPIRMRCVLNSNMSQ